MLYSNGFEFWHNFNWDTVLTESPIWKIARNPFYKPRSSAGSIKHSKSSKTPSFKPSTEHRSSGSTRCTDLHIQGSCLRDKWHRSVTLTFDILTFKITSPVTSRAMQKLRPNLNSLEQFVLGLILASGSRNNTSA